MALLIPKDPFGASSPNSTIYSALDTADLQWGVGPFAVWTTPKTSGWYNYFSGDNQYRHTTLRRMGGRVLVEGNSWLEAFFATHPVE